MKLSFAALLLCALLSSAAAQGTSSPSDTRAIRTVIEKFRTAIIAKDKAALASLPLNDAITFASSLDARTLATLRVRRPAAKRLATSSYPAFVAEITGAAEPQEEIFSDIVIKTDGTIASVHFAYRFEEHHKETNRGEESWGLINTDEGWKISSIIYSVSLLPPAK